MGSEWEKRPLGELTENFDSVRVPVKEKDRIKGPYPYYGASGIVDYVDNFLFDGEYLLIAEDGENLRTRNTPIAFMAKGKFWVNNHAHIVRGNNQNDTRYLMYALAIADINGYLTGSTMPKLTQGNMNRIGITAPPLSEQRAIAHILGTLDDKIELNRRMNQSLDEMARALFKSWFVDFDPVRAKAEGRETGLPEEIAALFPDEFEDSELGKIPKEWKVGQLGELVRNVVDRVQPSPFIESIPYVPIECISPRSVCLNEWQSGVNARSSLVAFRQGDILFGAMRPYFHKVCIAPFDGTTRTTAFVLRPEVTELTYAAFAISRDETIDYATAHSEGSTIPYAKWAGSLQAMKLIIPPPELRTVFHRFIWPSIERMLAGVLVNRTLADLRNALLPKLISGDLRITDAEGVSRGAV